MERENPKDTGVDVKILKWILSMVCQLESRSKICGFHGGDYEDCRLLCCYAEWLL
jgi:hypothetical protein